MTTSFPTSLQDLDATRGQNNDKLSSPNHVTHHALEDDTLEALQAKVGVNGSAVTTSHDYKLSGVTGSDKASSLAGTEVLTNKTLSTGSKILVGSDATGDIYYNGGSGVITRKAIGATGKILKVVAGLPSWEDETVTSNASTTVKGIVEAATQSEVTAGTATGGTGAVLVVTPDSLAGSTPVFNGSALTNLPTTKLDLVTTDVTFSSSTAENTLLSYSVAGGVLSTANAIRVTMHVSNLQVSNTNTWTVRFKYGATTITSKAYTASGGASITFNGKIEFILAASGATNSQNGSHFISLGRSGYTAQSAPNDVMMFTECAQGTSTEDSTASKTLEITSQHSNSSASDAITASLIVTELIR